MPPSVASLRRVAAIARNAWPESTGTGGRLAPELMAGMTGIRSVARNLFIPRDERGT
jgi:hypothetical protein